MDSSPSATRQPKQARAIRTRERLLEQAEQAFAEKGFEATSLTSDILEPAAISVGSFYHQFTDKRAVLQALLDERTPWNALATSLADAAGQATFVASVRQGLVTMLDDIDARPATWAIHFRELCSADADVRRLVVASWATWEAAVVSLFERWTDDGARRPGRLAFAMAGLSGVLRRYLDGDVADRRAVRDAMLDDAVAGCVASLAA